MEEKKHCKWYNDEFCTNGDSPCVADYCPVVEYPELCKFREVAEDINVHNKDEKTIEFDDDVVDLLVEFDEMGFTPTTTCPDPDECASDWRERLVCAIKSVLEELECEKHNHGVTKEFYNNSVANSEKIFAEQKTEIERLTERLDYFQKSSDYHEGNQKELEAKNAELQKQVDELTKENKWLTKENEELYNDNTTLIAGSILQKEQVEKDTAKEIYFKVKHESGVELSFLNDLALWIKDRFGIAVEKWIKVDGVEVE